MVLNPKEVGRAIKDKRSGILTKRVRLRQDNERPHTKQLLELFGRDTLAA